MCSMDLSTQDAEDEETEHAQDVLQIAALERACGLGRVAPAATLPLVTHHLNSLKSALLSSPRGGSLHTISHTPYPSYHIPHTIS